MTTRKAILAAFVFGVIAGGAQFLVAGEQEGPTVAIDFQQSCTLNLATIDSVYSGARDTIYAFLVIDAMPRGYVSAYDVAFELLSPDSSVVNLGFTRLPRWVRLESSEDGVPDDVALPGARTPTAIGFWTLLLTKGSESRAALRLGTVLERQDGGVVVFDGEGGPVIPTHLIPGCVNPQLQTPTDSLLGPLDFGQRDCRGNSIPEDRIGEYVPGNVIARFVAGAIELTEGRSDGTAANILSEGVARVTEGFGLTGLRRLYPHAARGEREIVSRMGAIVKLMDQWDVYVLEFPLDTDIWAVVDSLRTISECVYAEPNGVSRGCISPDDSLYQGGSWGPQWNLHRIGTEGAWDQQTGSTGVRLGILDSGIDYTHPDLGGGIGSGCKVGGGWDYVGNDSDPMDDAAGSHDSHGTHVAGIAGALTNNNRGVAGVAGGWGPANPGVTLYALKVADDSAEVDHSDAIPAISNAWSEYGISVLNASWGKCQTAYQALREAILDAHKAGVVFVAAKGNENSSCYHYPSDYDDDWVISVGATPYLAPPFEPEKRVDTLDGYSWGSNYGNAMDVLAPGLPIESTIRTTHTSPYGSKGGTSMAAPHVAGLAALILSDPGSDTLAVEDIEGIICASCTDIRTDVLAPGQDLMGYDQWSGWGRVNADSALRFLDWAYRIDHYASTGGYSVWNSGYIGMVFYGPGPLTTGNYRVKKYDVRCNVTYPQTYGNFVQVWGRGYGASTGWSQATPNFQVGYCGVVPGTETQTGCQLQSFVYEVWTMLGQPLGWYPCQPGQVVFAYTVLGGIPPASVRGGGEDGQNLVVSAPTQNPLLTGTRIAFRISEPQEVSVAVYDVMGEYVRELLEGQQPAGAHEVIWDGTDRHGRMLSPGIYFCRVETRTAAETVKIVLLR